MKSPRNIGIELLRCLAMLSVCVGHAVKMTGYGAGWEGRLFAWDVATFAFISGYYGIRFRPRRLLELWALAAVMVAVPAALSDWSNWKTFLFSNWFLNAYTILMLFSPVLNLAVRHWNDDGRRVSVLLPALALMAWAWAGEAYGFREFVPRVPGFGRQSAWALIFIYLGASAVRELGLIDRLRPWQWGALLVCLFPLNAIVGANTSLVTFATSVSLFALFARLKVAERVGRCVLFVVPSLFSVYLIHTNEVGYRWLTTVIEWIMGEGGQIFRWPAMVAAGVVVFLLCLAIDFLRRLALGVVRRLCKAIG